MVPEAPPILYLPGESEVVMEFDWNSLVNYGAIGLCLAYFIYKDNKTTRELKEAVAGLTEAVTLVKAFLDRG